MKYATDGIEICTPIELDLSLRRSKFPIDGTSKWGKQDYVATKKSESHKAKPKKQPPKMGLYVSTKKPLEMHLLVENVIFDDDEDFFLVEMIDESGAGDTSAMGCGSIQTNGLH